ncbi:hypothetical protein [Microvirga sp. BSC39]|uniref:hypothetical protein n=1 Tax=Microvirga sp. BSC39 TaxID=1549810 RepID=UPI0004E863DF|nr:hypothetical protein [Microvirga sp. BSC39]KFG66726.1 hypothetical protein JH26_25580 [Microvirga sp. BSC39]
MLAAAAAQSGRSISEEIERRVEKSFEPDALERNLGIENANDLIKEIGLIIVFQLAESGKDWQKDRATRDAIRAHINSLFESLDDESGHAAKKASQKLYEDRVANAWKSPSQHESFARESPFEDER